MIWKYNHSSEYAELVQQFPLVPITSSAQYNQAISVLHDLALHEKMTPAASDYFDVLCYLVRKYESKVSSVPEVTPQQVLEFLMEQHKLMQADISYITGVQRPHISEFFSGKRNLPRQAASRLGGYFKIDPAVFLPKLQPANEVDQPRNAFKDNPAGRLQSHFEPGNLNAGQVRVAAGDFKLTWKAATSKKAVRETTAKPRSIASSRKKKTR